MLEKKFARIEDGIVAEAGYFDSIEDRFHPSLVWVECPEEVGPGWSYEGGKFAPPATQVQTQEELVQSITNAVQARLDAFARERHYDGILSLCTYATDPSPRLSLEGQRGVDLRSTTWETCYQILNDVAGGKRPVPTVEDVFAALPMLTWPA